MLARSPRGALVFLQNRPYVCQSCLRRARSLPLAQGQSPTARAIQTATAPPPTDDAPFRKALKDAAKKKKKEERATSGATRNSSKARNPRLEKWELTVGIEIHAELNTARKLFSAAATSANATPNTHVALFDTAFPGTQPHFQKETVLPALRAALALNCEIQHRSSFDRKHYFYQDQPSGYQITQYYEPFARNGHITLYPHDFPAGACPDDGPVTIGIKQVQMEQDTAKTVHQPPSTHLLDFNRVSHPLIEIISLPQLHNPVTAAVFVRKIQNVLKAVNAVTAGMEMGGLRADVNVSVKERNGNSANNVHSYHGVGQLGQRTEIKNLASVKAIEDAIIAERDRQIDLLENGGVVEGETRGWTLGSKTTRRLRGKEGEIDYRYMPDPDIAPVFIGQDLVDHLRQTLPALSDETVSTLVDGTTYGLTAKDASTLILLDDGDRLDYYFDVVEHLRSTFSKRSEVLTRLGKVAGNWVLMELGALFKNEEWSGTKVPADQLATIVAHILRKEITGSTAKRLLLMKFEGEERSVEQIIADEDLFLRPLTHTEYMNLAQSLVEEKADMANDIVKKQQLGKIKWFVGQMMARSAEGTVEPAAAEAVLRELYGLSSVRSSLQAQQYMPVALTLSSPSVRPPRRAMSDTPPPAPALPQRQGQSHIRVHRQIQSHSQRQRYNQTQNANPRRIIPHHFAPTHASYPYLAEQDLAAHRLYTEILRLLISRRPRTLHIRQRYADAICPRRQGNAARVRERYGECKVVLGAVVLDLEVGFEVDEVEEGMGDRDMEGEGREQGKKRSCVERRRWLEGMERRIGLRRGVYGQLQDMNEVQEMPALQRMRGRSEPFQEREMVGRARDEETGTEYAAIAAGEGMLHPGVPASSRAGPCQMPAQRKEDGQERDRRAETRFRDQVSVARSASRESTNPSTRSMGASPTLTIQSMSTTKAVVSMGRSKVPFTQPKHSISARKANAPGTAMHSTSTINAIVLSERSVQTLTGPTPPSLFKSMKYMVSGSKYLKREMALRGSGQKKLQKRRSPCPDASVPSNSSSSRSADARMPFTSTSVKSRGTTSGLPNEIAAGSFGARPPTEEKEIKEKWWSTLFSSKPRSHGPNPGPGPWNKNAPWPLDPQQPPVEPRSGWEGGPVCDGRVGYAPAPSSVAQRNDGEASERSFGQTCGPECESCRTTTQVKEIAAHRTSLEEEPANKAPWIRVKDPANKAPLPSLQQPRMKKPLSPLCQPPMTTPAILVTSPSPLRTNVGYPPTKFHNYQADRLAVARSALPRTPGHGVVEPLAPQLRSILEDMNSKPNPCSPPRLNGVVVDEEAIWIQCSERLDYVSDIAATEARERIRRARAQRVAQEAVRAHNLKERSSAMAQEEMSTFTERRITPKPVESVPSLRVFTTETAGRAHLKRVSVANVDCRSVAGRREVPPRRQNVEATNVTGRKAMLLQKQEQPHENPVIAIRGLNTAILDLSVAARGAATRPEIAAGASTGHLVQKPLNTPWEAVWHRDIPVPFRQGLSQSPGTDSRAPSVPYSLSNAVAEAEAREQLHRPSPGEIMRLREGLLAKRGKLVYGANGQRSSMEAIVEDGMARFDSAMGMNEAQVQEGVKMRMEGGCAP
ncbi:hypothetical protein DPSP01_002498 [Paraphaeosphaeria sporulosa]